MPQRTPLVIGADGLPQQLQAADTIASNVIVGLRVENYTSTAANASGVATVTFTKAFTTAPTILPLTSISGTTVTVASVTAVTTTGCNLLLMSSRGTLVLSAGPFQAGAGNTVSLVAIGS